MTVFEGSRYEYNDIVRIVGPDGRARPTIALAENNSKPLFQFAWYTVKDGDRIDIIAARFLGEADLWWMLADYNPEWLYYDYLPPGTLLRIPNGLTNQG